MTQVGGIGGTGCSDNLANVLLEQRDTVGARRYYVSALEIRQSLASADPAGSLRSRDLWIGYGRLAYLCHLCGDHDGWETYTQAVREMAMAKP